jgi:hypothetical protein
MLPADYRHKLLILRLCGCESGGFRDCRTDFTVSKLDPENPPAAPFWLPGNGIWATGPAVSAARDARLKPRAGVRVRRALLRQLSLPAGRPVGASGAGETLCDLVAKNGS